MPVRKIVPPGAVSLYLPLPALVVPLVLLKKSHHRLTDFNFDLILYRIGSRGDYESWLTLEM